MSAAKQARGYVWPPKARWFIFPSSFRLHGHPQCSLRTISRGASFTKNSTMSWSARKSAPLTVSYACRSNESFSRIAAAVPPCAQTECDRNGWCFEITAMSSLLFTSAAATAALKPASPAPTMIMS